jgi:hypothetical protein
MLTTAAAVLPVGSPRPATASFARRARCAARVALCGLVAVGGVAALPAAPAGAADDTVARHPEPALYQASWELKFRHTAPKRIVVQSVASKNPVAYWYITYTVTNLGEKEEDFQPEFDLIAADGKVYRGNRAIAGDVFEAVRRAEGNPLLISPRKVGGLINVGPEQARDSVAIWEEPARKMGTFSIYVAGLSGESVTMKKVGDRFVPVDPKKAADELKDVKDEDRLTLRKQLQLTYSVLGDETNVGNAPVVKKAEKYVMR